ncbi:LamG-like jellyroll fold domain-containing protein [Larkinella sp. C7]|uniref:LamG-like jellyroll fold domain-containing protein n=1 Tax=Larkinella sp. C7 TaxID=2576607 RepID=UPI001111114C|nr:LamG-like jellyroll fold domain-containing protein [Larkinella sp. C7]
MNLRLPAYFTLVCFFLFGCEGWDFERKSFQSCAKPSAQISFTAEKLRVTYKLVDIQGDFTTVSWNFGAGNPVTSSEREQTFTYSGAGTYTVNAELKNPCGDTYKATLTAQITNASLASVTTLDPSGVSSNSALMGVKVNDAGNATISQYGVCYSNVVGVPDINNSTVLSSKTGLVIDNNQTFQATQLLPNTLYYVRAFATNEAGTSYGVVKTFLTTSQPVVNTLAATAITGTSAVLSLSLTNPGTPVLTRYGVYVSSTSTDPGKTGSYQTFNTDTQGIAPSLPGNKADFTVSGLQANTLYYYRAFAINATGTVYGAVLTFNTLASSITSGLVAYYPLDGNANDFAGTNHGKLVNQPPSTTDRKDAPNSAVFLDGDNDFVEIPDHPVLRFTNAMTVSFWVKPTGTVSQPMQLLVKSRYTGGDEQYGISIRPLAGNSSNHVLNVDVKQNSNCISGAGWENASYTVAQWLNNWHHVVGVYEGRSLKLYLDGKLVASRENLPISNIDNCPGGDVRLGLLSQAFPNKFQGSVDELRFYNRALTLVDVQSLFAL